MNTNELIFDSFDGGGYDYTVVIDDESIVNATETHQYRNANHEELCGSGYDVIITFAGIKKGSTRVTIKARSLIIPDEDYFYKIDVDDLLNVSISKIKGDA